MYETSKNSTQSMETATLLDNMGIISMNFFSHNSCHMTFFQTFPIIFRLIVMLAMVFLAPSQLQAEENESGQPTVLIEDISSSQNNTLLNAKQNDTHGRFHGDVITKWLPDGRTMELLETLVFVDPRGEVWDAPKGAIIDGASIPEQAWSLVGGPYSGKYREASVIHDVACDLKERDWRKVHLVFFEAMLASGVPEQEARLKYTVVHNFGPRWDEGKHEKRLTEAELKIILSDPEKNKAYVDDLLRDTLADSVKGEIDDAVIKIKIDVMKHGFINTGRELIHNSIAWGHDAVTSQKLSFSSLSAAVEVISPYITFKNSMMVLLFLSILGGLVYVLGRIWIHLLLLSLVLFVANFMIDFIA